MKSTPRTDATSGSKPQSVRLSTHSEQLSRRIGVRSGFTMIELMIVIVIIAILVGLLVPAAGRAIHNTRVTGVKAEISQLVSAIAKFKVDHGVEPPSVIVLHENGSDWQNDPTNTAIIRQIWPQYNFSIQQDFNGNGTKGETGTAGAVALSGSECLVVFLGGMFTKSAGAAGGSSTVFSMIGFSKDPTNPFATGGSREAPLFEFNTARLTDVDNDGIPEYKDSIPSQKNPYLYYSGYDGQGYNSNTNTATNTTGEFMGFNLYNATTSTTPPTAPVTYGLFSCYLTSATANTAWNPNSFQIISPGFDGVNQLGTGYGYGGAYIPKGNPALPLLSSPPSGLTAAAYANLRAQEADNITNFAQAELQY